MPTQKVKAQISGNGRYEELYDVSAYHKTNDTFSLKVENGKLYICVNGMKIGHGANVGG